MSDLHNDTPKPGAKPAYSPPRVVRLGDLNEGVGACATGSGVVAPVVTPCTGNGANANGACNTDGSIATGGNCDNHGMVASAVCSANGAGANSGSCTGSGGNAVSCGSGSTK